MKKVVLLIGLLTAVLLSMEAKDYAFKVEVQGKGKPMVLIPGLACSGRVWDRTIDQLGEAYEYHVVTLPGFAGETPVTTPNYLADMGDELIRYMKDQQLNQPVIVGHSLGGFLALYIGSTAPDLASRLVVVDGLPYLGAIQNPSLTPKDVEEMAIGMRTNMELQTAAQYEAMQPLLLKSMMNSAADIATVMEWGRRSDQKTVAQAMFELYQIDLRDEIASIKVPTLVLGAWIAYKSYGATRASTMQLYEAQFKNLKDYELKMTDKGKHFIMWDDPDFFEQELRLFLDAKS